MQSAPHLNSQIKGPDPVIAAALSVIPGCGHLYNGDRRKGVLFLLATFFSLFPLAFFGFSQSFLLWASNLAWSCHLRFNSPALFSMHEITPGSPQSLVIFALFLSFMVFAMFDAHKRALSIRQATYVPSFDLKTSEATSGSYIAHSILMALFLTYCFAFYIPPRHFNQIVDIEFEDYGASNHDAVSASKEAKLPLPLPSSDGKHLMPMPTSSSSQPETVHAVRPNTMAQGANSEHAVHHIRVSPPAVASLSKPATPEASMPATSNASTASAFAHLQSLNLHSHPMIAASGPGTPAPLPRNAVQAAHPPAMHTGQSQRVNATDIEFIQNTDPLEHPVQRPATPSRSIHIHALQSTPAMPAYQSTGESGESSAVPHTQVSTLSGTELPQHFPVLNPATGHFERVQHLHPGESTPGNDSLPEQSNSVLIDEHGRREPANNAQTVGGLGGPIPPPVISSHPMMPAQTAEIPRNTLDPRQQSMAVLTPTPGTRRTGGPGGSLGPGPGMQGIVGQSGQLAMLARPTAMTSAVPSALVNPRMTPQGEFEDSRVNYMNEMAKRIAANCSPDLKHPVYVAFKISESGEISDLRKDRPGPLDASDQAALTTIENAAPFGVVSFAHKGDVEVAMRVSQAYLNWFRPQEVPPVTQDRHVIPESTVNTRPAMLRHMFRKFDSGIQDPDSSSGLVPFIPLGAQRFAGGGAVAHYTVTNNAPIEAGALGAAGAPGMPGRPGSPGALGRPGSPGAPGRAGAAAIMLGSAGASPVFIGHSATRMSLNGAASGKRQIPPSTNACISFRGSNGDIYIEPLHKGGAIAVSGSQPGTLELTPSDDEHGVVVKSSNMPEDITVGAGETVIIHTKGAEYGLVEVQHRDASAPPKKGAGMIIMSGPEPPGPSGNRVVNDGQLLPHESTISVPGSLLRHSSAASEGSGRHISGPDPEN